MHLSEKPVPYDGLITAVLGPTNTGKTYEAIERMVSHKTGVIGFPLRLLARENYDRLVKMVGPQAVALVTGEEKIIPGKARYFCCTVESMPVDKDFEFLAVDEVQLCADPERGHVFTDRILRARGTEETYFMGSDTIQPLLARLIPNIDFVARARFSKLSYKGFKKMTRLPKRSAIVAFSIEDVYSIAEMIRTQRGGTAVVLGALSPRTRNRQVEMYQSGEVDFLVATDAIGMGLNMDINHIAIASNRKFDGHKIRDLTKAELAQVAGRAGRYKRDGTFGVTGRLRDLKLDVVEAIEAHKFEPLEYMIWRNSHLDLSSPLALSKSLDIAAKTDFLVKGRQSDDFITLQGMMEREQVMGRAGSSAAVRLLWDVCQIPDFRKTLSERHHELVAHIFGALIEGAKLEDGYVGERLERLKDIKGDVDTLMNRIAHIRTWTYITHKSEWVHNAADWQSQARAIEDTLSDALHEALMRRFVDRRSAILLQAKDKGDEILAGVRANGDVVVEGQNVGRLAGFRFYKDDSTSESNYKAIMGVVRQALRPEIKRRVLKMLKADDKQFQLLDDGKITYQPLVNNPVPGDVIAEIKKGQSLLNPDIFIVKSDLLEGQDETAIAEHLKGWLDRHIKTTLEALIPLQDEDLTASARGIAYQLHESLGIVPRADLEEIIATLDDDGRAALRQRRVKLGPVLVFLPALNKPAAVKLRALLWSLWNEKALPAQTPPDGVTSLTVDPKTADPVYYRSIGYPVYGPRAIRVDMLDRVINLIYDTAEKGEFKAKHEMAEWLGSSIPDLYAVLEAMGHTKFYDPAEDAEKAEKAAEGASNEEASSNETKKKAPVIKEEIVKEGAAKEDAKAEDKSEEKAADDKSEGAKQEDIKPELATFKLRRGKAYSKKSPAHKKPEKPRNFKGKGKKPHGNKPKKKTVHKAEAKSVADSPFAMLQALKDGSSDKS